METWLLLRSGAGQAAENMAVDEALLLSRLQQPVLRLYSWAEPAASFGYFQHYEDVARATPLRPLVRRPTGGGIVPHDNDWTYSLVFPPPHAWYALKATESYRRVHEWVQEAFVGLKIGAQLAAESRQNVIGQCFAGAERHDVLWQGRKIAGAAQRRTRDGLLIQGSIQPPPGVDRANWEASLCASATENWQVAFQEWPLPPELQKTVHHLAREKYSSRDYNERR